MPSKCFPIAKTSRTKGKRYLMASNQRPFGKLTFALRGETESSSGTQGICRDDTGANHIRLNVAPPLELTRSYSLCPVVKGSSLSSSSSTATGQQYSHLRKRRLSQRVASSTYVCIIGISNRLSFVPTIRPPTTAIASGDCVRPAVGYHALQSRLSYATIW